MCLQFEYQLSFGFHLLPDHACDGIAQWHQLGGMVDQCAAWNGSRFWDHHHLPQSWWSDEAQ